MVQSVELEVLAFSEYRLLELPDVTRRAQQDRELSLARDAATESVRGTPFRWLRRALARGSERQSAPNTTTGRI